jgi:hypothetical protein
MRTVIAKTPVATLIALVALIAGAGACGTFSAQAPPGFVALDDPEPAYDYRATTPDGVVLAVRVLDNEPRGDEAFWSDAITGRMRQQGGYAALEAHPVRTRSGLAGRRLRFGHDQGARPHLYDVALFVTRRRIYLLEAGGDRAAMDRAAPHLDTFLATFQPRRCWFRACTQPALPPRAP